MSCRAISLYKWGKGSREQWSQLHRATEWVRARGGSNGPEPHSHILTEQPPPPGQGWLDIKSLWRRLPWLMSAGDQQIIRLFLCCCSHSSVLTGDFLVQQSVLLRVDFFFLNSFKGKRVSLAGTSKFNVHHFDGLEFPGNYRNPQLNNWYNK